ncbi:hypothetical protein EBT16_05165 [bacterium]|nr:hypothetical protein [bacterium]
MKKVTSALVAITLILGGFISPKSASACSSGSCGVSESHGYYKKIVIKKVKTIKRSCTTCAVAPVCHGCGYRSYRPFYAGYGTRFTGGPLQFRWGQPIRNVLRVPARLGVRAASLVGGVLRGVGSVLFPRRFY